MTTINSIIKIAYTPSLYILCVSVSLFLICFIYSVHRSKLDDPILKNIRFILIIFIVVSFSLIALHNIIFNLGKTYIEPLNLNLIIDLTTNVV